MFAIILYEIIVHFNGHHYAKKQKCGEHLLNHCFSTVLLFEGCRNIEFDLLATNAVAYHFFDE